jgi:starch-binding outer membrane protein, SusD/RagB family
MMDMKKIKGFLLIGFSAALVFSCSEEYLDTAPTDAVSKDVIFETVTGAEVAMNGVYRWMYAWNQLGTGRHDDWGYRTLGLKADLMGHDMKVFSRGFGWFIADYNYTGRQQVTDNSTSSISYNLNYDIVYNCNVIIEEIDEVQGEKEERDFIKAQALTARAHAYHWLAQFHASTYAGNQSAPCVPLKLESSDRHEPIATVQQVYEAIVTDLDNAIILFEDAQAAGITRPAKSYIDLSVAMGLRARVALVMEDWIEAIANAQAARTEVTLPARLGYELMDATEYTSGFNSVESPEWMWGFDINDEQNTVYASFFSHMDPIRLSYASLGLQKQIPEYLYDTISDTDIRKQVFVEPGDIQWFDFEGNPVPEYTSVKFITPTWAADYIMMRLSEMYLIEAEAAAMSGQDAVARSAINNLLEARDPGRTIFASGQALIEAIRLERRIELWGEGFGLFDIKRWKIDLDRKDHDPTLCLETWIPANSNRFNLRVPQYEIDANDAINEGDQIN